MKPKSDESVLSSPSFILPFLWKQAEKYQCISFFSFVQLTCHFCFVIAPKVSLTSDCHLCKGLLAL